VHEIRINDGISGSHLISPARRPASGEGCISAGKGIVSLSPTSAVISLYHVMMYAVRAPLTVLKAAAPKVGIGAASSTSLAPPLPSSIRYLLFAPPASKVRTCQSETVDTTLGFLRPASLTLYYLPASRPSATTMPIMQPWPSPSSSLHSAVPASGVTTSWNTATLPDSPATVTAKLAVAVPVSLKVKVVGLKRTRTKPKIGTLCVGVKETSSS
jgi:hypothetical protein